MNDAMNRPDYARDRARMDALHALVFASRGRALPNSELMRRASVAANRNWPQPICEELAELFLSLERAV